MPLTRRRGSLFRAPWAAGGPLAAALAAASTLATPACDDTPPACSTLAEQCGGTSDCYAGCVCRTGDASMCLDTCAPPSDSPLLLDVPARSADTEEASAIDLINGARAIGGCCGGGGCFGPSPPLAVVDSLTLAARRHAVDMATRDYFSHMTPEGITATDRIRAEGFHGCAVGENLAAGYSIATDVLAAWLASDDHCQNLLWPSFDSIGIARDTSGPPDLGTVWVADFGARAP